MNIAYYLVLFLHVVACIFLIGVGIYLVVLIWTLMSAPNYAVR